MIFIVFSPCQILGRSIRGGKGGDKFTQVLAGNPEQTIRGRGRRWENNIVMYLQEIGSEDMV
jgi:hypothetical protein